MSKKGKRLREFEKNNRTYTFAERSKITHKDKVKEEVTQSRPERKKKKLKIVNMKRFIASVIISTVTTLLSKKSMLFLSR